ncbi:MAG: nucleotidyltransferase family protein, partial [Oscillospiraceae bacterium]
FIRKIALKGDIIQAQQLCDENFGFLDFHFAKTDVILAILRTKTKDYFNSLADCENGLGDKIYDSVKKANTFEEVVELSKSKCYTRAKICRIIFSAVLQIDKTYTKSLPNYIRILGFNQNGKDVLKHCKNNLEIFTSIKRIEQFDKSCEKMALCEVLSTDIFNLMCVNIKKPSQEYTQKVIIV